MARSEVAEKPSSSAVTVTAPPVPSVHATEPEAAAWLLPRTPPVRWVSSPTPWPAAGVAAASTEATVVPSAGGRIRNASRVQVPTGTSRMARQVSGWSET